MDCMSCRKIVRKLLVIYLFASPLCTEPLDKLLIPSDTDLDRPWRATTNRLRSTDHGRSLLCLPHRRLCPPQSSRQRSRQMDPPMHHRRAVNLARPPPFHVHDPRRCPRVLPYNNGPHALRARQRRVVSAEQEMGGFRCNGSLR